MCNLGYLRTGPRPAKRLRKKGKDRHRASAAATGPATDVAAVASAATAGAVDADLDLFGGADDGEADTGAGAPQVAMPAKLGGSYFRGAAAEEGSIG